MADRTMRRRWIISVCASVAALSFGLLALRELQRTPSASEETGVFAEGDRGVLLMHEESEVGVVVMPTMPGLAAICERFGGSKRELDRADLEELERLNAELLIGANANIQAVIAAGRQTQESQFAETARLIKIHRSWAVGYGVIAVCCIATGLVLCVWFGRSTKLATSAVDTESQPAPGAKARSNRPEAADGAAENPERIDFSRSSRIIDAATRREEP